MLDCVQTFTLFLSFQEQQKADESRNSRLETLNQDIDVMLEKVNISLSRRQALTFLELLHRFYSN